METFTAPTENGKKVMTMDEYIEREAVYEDFEKCNNENPKCTPSRVKTLVARQKSADVAPVRHRRWKCHGDCGVTECSVCGWSIEEYAGDYAYCPECGARMDGGSENG